MSQTGGAATLERELLTRLGLPAGASEAEVEHAHDDIVAYLEGAPADLRGWAQQRTAEADEAYVLLSDRDTLDRVAAAREHALPAAPAVPRRRRGGAGRSTTEPPARAAVLSPAWRRALIGVAAVLAIGIAGYYVYTSDLPAVPALSGTPAPENARQVDPARVGQLMELIAADANDVAALQALADLYFDAGDYGVAASWENRILAVDPDNVTANLAYGAAQYNLGNSADAEVHWRRVIAIDPDDVNALAEAHYDLGFMYFSADPPDIERTITEWRRVLEIAPGSDIAQTVTAHLATLEEWQASPAAAPQASPAPSGPPSTPSGVSPGQ